MQAGGQYRDLELFQAVQAGSGQALAELYDKYSSLVYSYALRACGETECAEELTQDTFVRLWTTKGAFDPNKSQFKTWLLTITRRLNQDRWRRVTHTRTPRGEWKGLSSIAGPIPPSKKTVFDPALDTAVVSNMKEYSADFTMALAERTWFRQEVLASLQGLSEEERRVVELAYFHGLTLREVAEHLHRPLGTVKTRLNRALSVLREDMQAWKGGFQA